MEQVTFVQRPNTDRAAENLRRVTTLICGAILLLMMGITVVDVIGRYAMNAPLRGATEVTELLLVCLIFVCLPAVCLDKDHVVVDLFTGMVPIRWQPLRAALAGSISAVVLGVIAWRLLVYGQQFASYGGKTSTLDVPIAPVAYLCAATTLVGALVMAGVAADALRKGQVDE
ncbi:TRAP transporter small permease [Roseobacter sp. MH60115]|uniref:TRAP transporter small permease n=1 Tax=Roseobacter sp. MH60115 TaxID=2785324 RepID=UPI0018A28CE1|nr:TRAP transporter small permease [Roseobacter sp. MH60115]